MVSQISGMYGKKREGVSASKISANNVAKREYQKDYMEYCTYFSEPFSTFTLSKSESLESSRNRDPPLPSTAALPSQLKYLTSKKHY